jgi:hypothetical protein
MAEWEQLEMKGSWERGNKEQRNGKDSRKTKN